MRVFWAVTVLASAVLSLSFASVAQDKTASSAKPSVSAPLPAQISFWLYPDNLHGRRGHKVEVSILAQDSNSVTGRVTMYGQGQNHCVISARTVKGTFDGEALVLAVVVEKGDNFTCPMSFTLKRGANGFEGRFKNEPYAGDVKTY